MIKLIHLSVATCLICYLCECICYRLIIVDIRKRGGQLKQFKMSVIVVNSLFKEIVYLNVGGILQTTNKNDCK